MDRQFLLAWSWVVLATGLGVTPAASADRAARPVLIRPAPPVGEIDVPVVVERSVPAIVLAPDFRDPRTRRCQPGYAENQIGFCVRFDEPRIVCGPTRYAPDACFVTPPNPAPYGLGVGLRPDY